MNEIKVNKDFGIQRPIVTRSDGLQIDISKVTNITKSDKKIMEALFYIKISELTPDELDVFSKYLIANLLLAVNSRKKEDEIRILKDQFKVYFWNSERDLSVQEIKMICYNGIRGQYSTDSFENNITVANFYRWKMAYIEDRNASVKRILDVINFINIESDYDFEMTKHQINSIIRLKSIDLEVFEKECLLFSKMIPSFMFDQLVLNKVLKSKSYLKNIKTAELCLKENTNEKKISNILSLMYESQKETTTTKVERVAKQLTIYEFIKKSKTELK